MTQREETHEKEKEMDSRKYIVPTLIPLTIGIERGFAFSSEGFDKDDETDAGWE